MRDDVRQLMEVTESGWINCFMIKKWLETVFDAYTRELFPVVSDDCWS